MGANYSLGLLYLRGDRPDAGRQLMETFRRLKQERLAGEERMRQRAAVKEKLQDARRR